MSDGQLYHTIRQGSGTWQPSFGRVEDVVAKGPKQVIAAGGAGLGTALHVVALGDDTELYHTIRNADGSWQSYFGQIESVVAGGVEFHRVSTAGVGTDLHVVASDPGGALFHTIRHGDGSWQKTFGAVASVVAGGRPFTSTGCAGVGTSMHIVAAGVDGNLYHTIRNADGSWQKTFGVIESVVTGGSPFGAVACAGVGTSLHVVAVSNGNLYHTIRNPDGSWQHSFGIVESVVAGGSPFNAVSCAAVGTSLHVVAVSHGDVYHTIRNPDGSWQKTFGVVESVVTGGPPFCSFVASGGTAPALQVLTGDWQGGFL